jgi:hypothetical protein
VGQFWNPPGGQFYVPFNTAKEVDASGAGRHPLRSKPVQLLQSLLIDRLDRHRPYIRAACSFDQRCGISRIGLVATDICACILSWQKDHFMPLTTQAPGMVVGRATSLHHHAAGGSVDEEAVKPRTAQTLPLDNMPALVG